MGNCLVLQGNVIKVIKSDGKVLEYKAPIKVHQLLSQFSGHAISDSTFPNIRPLRPDAKLIGGNVYHLVPLPMPTPKVSKKKVRFSKPEVLEDGQQSSGVVRIKLVITKKELQEILQKGGVVSIDDMVSQLQSKQSIQRVVTVDDDKHREGWKPVLESIPEANL
ncbi:DUF4228 domain-containing protein [Cephalotus follicularis]|uniref:DUF4228 domain-containing protein n=1 Tax=Cephalotus follicularis TaxID=3775 RepID=A0A1Q3BFS3_CEPFO|nr:DUF4228 domain-containing protein [Cephalotus follicularis]